MNQKKIIFIALIVGVILALVFSFREFSPGVNFFNFREAAPNDAGDDFSLSYPEGFRVTSQEGGDGSRLIVAENLSAGSGQEGFQIFIIPFDEPGPITPARIWEDVNIEIENPQEGVIAGIPALAFESIDENFGPTFEVWFVEGGKLYQITTYRSFAERLVEILKTWEFN